MTSFEQFVFNHQVLFREEINGAAMILCSVLSLMIVSYLCMAWWGNEDGHWTRTPGVPTACGMFWIFTAEAYRTGAIWAVYQFHFIPTGPFTDVKFWPTLGYIVAGCIFNVGLLRCIYLFSPPVLRWAPGYFALLLATGFIIMSQLAS